MQATQWLLLNVRSLTNSYGRFTLLIRERRAIGSFIYTSKSGKDWKVCLLRVNSCHTNTLICRVHPDISISLPGKCG
jgi:hypothetical protein